MPSILSRAHGKRKADFGVSSNAAVQVERFTAEDLLAYANAYKPGMKRRQVTEWISLGLIDSPHKPGLGRGSGSAPGTWPWSQRELFRVLWARWSEGIPALCNIPVYLWMFWGDEHVPLRQVRKVMRTWLDRVQFVSAASADFAAGQMLGVFGRQSSSRANRELLAQALRGRKPDLEQVRREISRAAKTSSTIRVHGSRTQVVIDERVMMGLLSGRISAEENLAGLPDARYEWARYFALFGESAYAHDQPALASDPVHGRLFSARHHSDFMNSACANLLTVLGATLGVKPKPEHAGTVFDPTVWEKQNLRGVIEDTHLHDDGLTVDLVVVPAAGAI